MTSFFHRCLGPRSRRKYVFSEVLFSKTIHTLINSGERYKFQNLQSKRWCLYPAGLSVCFCRRARRLRRGRRVYTSRGCWENQECLPWLEPPWCPPPAAEAFCVTEVCVCVTVEWKLRSHRTRRLCNHHKRAFQQSGSISHQTHKHTVMSVNEAELRPLQGDARRLWQS